MLFFDFETRSRADLPKVGARRYAMDPTTHIVLCAYALNDQPAQVWSPLEGEPVPAELMAEDFHVAFNCEFDELIWRYCGSKVGLPDLDPDLFLDAQAQAAASLYPTDLAGCGRVNGGTQKRGSGKTLIQKFAIMHGPKPEPIDFTDPDWLEYKAYAIDDVEVLRTAWVTSAQLTRTDWIDYRVTREINDRGLPIDREFCLAAEPLLDEAMAEISEECARLTGGVVTAPTQSVRIRDYVVERLPEKLAGHATTKRDKDGVATAYSLDKSRLSMILYDIEAEDIVVDGDLFELLELLVHGRNVTGAKLVKMAAMSTKKDPKVYGSYNLNGAGKTGRFSSRGIQMHNLTRDSLPGEFEFMEALVDDVEAFKAMCAAQDLKTNFALSRLVRPAILADRGKTLVWGDWSQIEARILPWLSNDRRADPLLASFARNEDVYSMQAAGIFSTALGDVNKEQRQAGKVAVLALGFGGGVHAYQLMARNYGLRVGVAEATVIRDGWRRTNPWAQPLWYALEDAFKKAIQMPGVTFPVGRVSYTYMPNLMRGTVVCMLPDGRPLMYPEAKIRERRTELDDGTIKVSRQLSHRDSHTYTKSGKRAWAWTWGGVLAENITQATAASLLRRTLRTTRDWDVVIGHTHDEVLMQVPRNKAAKYSTALQGAMEDPPTWADGLPIDAEIDSWSYYTKADLNKLKTEGQ